MDKAFKHIEYVYLIGIGGIGMSALARYFKQAGKRVSGYDRVQSRVTDMLLAEGIGVTTENEVETIPLPVRRAVPESVLVIYTAAIRQAHTQLDWFRNNGFATVKRAWVLGEIAGHYRLIAVGGTHGKTTTSCLLAHLLSASGMPFMAILGGISTDLGSNFTVRGDRPEFLVTEADEFDGSFMHLTPYITILTSTDADHLDYYKTGENIKLAYQRFASSTLKNGLLLYQAETDIQPPADGAPALSYGLESGNIHAENVHVKDGKFYFNYVDASQRLDEIVLGVRGLHNVENAVAAIAAALHTGQDTDSIVRALASFKGVQRRFEYVIERDDLVYIDDYAHHPTELTSTILSVKELYPGRRITGIFQPHLYSRTRDFADGFAHSLALLDEAILMPVYPAREEPIAGVNAEMILNKMNHEHASVMTGDQIMVHLKQNRPEILLTLGAGDIDRLVEPLKSALT